MHIWTYCHFGRVSGHIPISAVLGLWTEVSNLNHSATQVLKWKQHCDYKWNIYTSFYFLSFFLFTYYSISCYTVRMKTWVHVLVYNITRFWPDNCEYFFSTHMLYQWIMGIKWKWKKKQQHIVRRILKSNIKIAGRGKIDTDSTQSTFPITFLYWYRHFNKKWGG